MDGILGAGVAGATANGSPHSEGRGGAPPRGKAASDAAGGGAGHSGGAQPEGAAAAWDEDHEGEDAADALDAYFAAAGESLGGGRRSPNQHDVDGVDDSDESGGNGGGGGRSGRRRRGHPFVAASDGLLLPPVDHAAVAYPPLRKRFYPVSGAAAGVPPPPQLAALHASLHATVVDRYTGHGRRGALRPPFAHTGAEATRLGRHLGVSVGVIIGGGGRYAQLRALREAGPPLVVATPGRLLDVLGGKGGAGALGRVTLLVLDEADRMLSLGFEQQVRSVVAVTRPDRQTLLYSATWPRSMERLALDTLTSPAAWLAAHLPSFTAGTASAVLFASTRGSAAALANDLRAAGTPTACVHGETDAADRVALLRLFRSGDVRLLVSTDLAARGLDVPTVGTVVNVEPATDWDAHTHRVGRTGRAGRRGVAYTLLVRGVARDVAFAGVAARALREGGVPPEGQLLELAAAGGTGGGWGGEAETAGARAAGGGGAAGEAGGTGGGVAVACGWPPPSPPG
ncbi:hypothetical protein I4F81_004068 [Pyropia yezoensis]|uniref:Uncharacterized protein n=1 Tax=Pyropia yezoensis TaxID=2788 RepID=A0ACC3BTW2_PYRYE|nr:hypothetical protein I4F81_004068 [Neopyropia yezoensis]